MRHIRTAALLAMVAGMGLPIDNPPQWAPRQEPDDRGRRAEKDAIALAKAEEKRRRRAAKRVADAAKEKFHGLCDTPISPPVLNTWQDGALAKIKRLLGHHTIPDGDRFHVTDICDIGHSQVMVFGYAGQAGMPRWFDYRYAFKIGLRGAITMVDGPSVMEGFEGNTWCGIHVKLNHMRKSK